MKQLKAIKEDFKKAVKGVTKVTAVKY